MALDLLSRKVTTRNFSRIPLLTTASADEILHPETPLTRLYQDTKAEIVDSGVKVRKTGGGFAVSKTLKF